MCKTERKTPLLLLLALIFRQWISKDLAAVLSHDPATQRKYPRVPLCGFGLGDVAVADIHL